MASAALKKLATLDKAGAPIQHQVDEAAVAVGFSHAIEEVEDREIGKEPALSRGYHGRKEYILRWTLKKWAEDGDIGKAARASVQCWELFTHCVNSIPVRNSARILQERKFTSLLRRTVEEGLQDVQLVVPGIVRQDGIDKVTDSVFEEASQAVNRSSKKRKRDGTPVESGNLPSLSALRLQRAMLGALDLVVRLSKPKASQSGVFESEYMRSALRTTSEEAAEIFGGWLKWSYAYPWWEKLDSNWLNSPLEIWNLHVSEDQDALIFSRTCLKSVLTLMTIIILDEGQMGQLEKLLARNIVVPARHAYDTTSQPALLLALINPLFEDDTEKGAELCPMLFTIAIRCIQTHENRRRRPNETAWLQAFFKICHNFLPRPTDELSAQASTRSLLKISLERKVQLQTSFLRSMVKASSDIRAVTDFELLSLILALDCHVFLETDPEELIDLKLILNDLTYYTGRWDAAHDQSCLSFILPLMDSFAKTRNLAGFVHEWYDQLKVYLQSDMAIFAGNLSFWEDDAMQKKFEEHLESCMTVGQVSDLLEWLGSKSEECLSAVYIISDAIAMAITRDEYISVAAPWLISLTTRYPSVETRNYRDNQRFWRVGTRCLEWISLGYSNDDVGRFKAEMLNLLNFHLRSEEEQAFLFVFPYIARCACFCWNFGFLQDEEVLYDEWKHILQERLEKFPEAYASFLNASRTGRGDKASQTFADETRNSEGVVTPSPIVEELWQKFDIWRDSCYIFLKTVCVECPQVLEVLFKSTAEPDFFKTFISLATASQYNNVDNSFLESIWEDQSKFPDLFYKLLSNEDVLNNSNIIGRIIDDLLLCSTSEGYGNRFATSNRFVVDCLLRLPLEVFSVSQKAKIMASWPVSAPTSPQDDDQLLSLRMGAIHPAVLSLKVKMLRSSARPDRLDKDQLIYLADAVGFLSSDPKTVLPIFLRLASLIIGYSLGVDPAMEVESYLNKFYLTFEEQLSHSQDYRPNLAFFGLLETIISAIDAKIKVGDPGRTHSQLPEVLEKYIELFNRQLSSMLKKILQQTKNLDFGEKDSPHAYGLLIVLRALGPTPLSASILSTAAYTLKIMPGLHNASLLDQIESLQFEYFPESIGTQTFLRTSAWDISTVHGRHSVRAIVKTQLSGMPGDARLHFMKELLLKELSASGSLAILYAWKHAIIWCDDSREVSVSQEIDEPPFTLSTAYHILADHLWKCVDIRQFCLVSEMLETILRTKSHSISQYNIDLTLCSIATTCSQAGPSLPTQSSRTIYGHLLRLYLAILTSHRLKLRGRYHTVIQSLTALLRCFFSSISSSTSHSHTLPPTWLASRSSPTAHHLTASHATDYTRLITLICSPTLSAVSHHPASSSTTDNTGNSTLIISLHNPTTIAKNQAAQHMPVLLSNYIKLQLDMTLRLAPEVREALVPAVYAIFDTMNKADRRILGEGLDAGGRAVLGEMVRDWTRWGKWKGN